ncbi:MULTISPECIES: SDR family oxidoreductase [unclassified Chelatococcus]|uniref:SDR family oxidoreductase n=1 Tax=unclassified Chelatococcus TaxID=2638111 RepID=UPI001BCEA509|nr:MULTISPECIES: SDR family oxidoreductase [unclassified Chelatococcus]MBS7700795.1 SDR family oxidoreductase [Chelatococcus sp. YT9]MBX3559653.1 SDR family oxidoreductase [Chelatococcus sp.]
MATSGLVDPRTLYPKPPFPSQPQPVPGLAQQMVPAPDHGERTYRGSGKLEGRRALITGGDSGIGRAVAIAFAREGADVAIAYLPDEEPDAREVITLIEAEGRKALSLAGDIKDEGWCRKIVAMTAEHFGGLDLLVINAGRQQYREHVEELSTADFDRTLKTNLYALHWITQAAVPYLEPGSAILTTASVQAYQPSPILLDYATTKAGIVAYTKALAKQLIRKGIRVNAVAPGPVWTVLQPSGGQPDEKVRHFGEESDFGRPAQPVELAPVYVLLASQDASFINGEVYGVTGGKGIA